MTDKKRKLEPPLYLDLDFDEALSRFVATDPKEVDESIKRAKKKKPPEDGASRRSARSNERGGASPPGRTRKPSGD